MTKCISVVVPVRNEAAAIAATLARLREPEVLEVLVVDGHSTDDTIAIATPLVDRVLASEPGRAKQLNAGARAARGEILFFLHADTLVPAGFAAAIEAACERAIGGRFDVRLDAPGLGFRVVESAINLRSRWSGLFTGDQGMFVRRDVFDELGGFPDQPLMEDLELALAMKRCGPVVALRERVTTSARRWQRHGVLRTIVLMWWLRARWALGADAAVLAELYRDAR